MTRPLLGATLLAVTLVTPRGDAQPAAPPPPARFDAHVRYRIDSPRDQYVAFYDRMIAHLKRSGFEFVPPLDTLPETDREDRSKNRITGTIAPANVLGLFADRHVESVLLLPPGFKPPAPQDKGDEPRVRVRLELNSGFSPERQRVLARQAAVLLEQLGFREAVGYDHRGYTLRPHTRLVGTLPVGSLNLALRDLRTQPGGWFGPRVQPQDLPPPLSQVVPVLVTEVLGDAPAVAGPTPSVPRGEPFLDRISDDLWALASDKATQDNVVRMEIILAAEPLASARDTAWREALRAAAPSLFIEGRLGPVVTCLARAGQARSLAAVPLVSTVRLPRAARVAVSPGLTWEADNARALSESGVAALHARGHRGKDVRVAVIDADFTGYEALVKAGKLPPGTRLIDLTAERSPDLLPEPQADAAYLGHGTRCAAALAVAAPESQLTLVRIDPASPYMLREVAAAVRGDAVRSEYLAARGDQLAAASSNLRQRRLEILKERPAVLENYTDEADFDREYGILGDVGAWLYSPRRWHRMRWEEWQRDDAEHRERELRFLKLMSDIQSLQGTHVVSCSLTWNEGYPLGGASPLSRWLDEALMAPCRPGEVRPLWFQSAGNTGGQTWDAPFRDEDGNGVLEFAAPGTRLLPSRWTRELNFLAWRPLSGGESLDLPAGARVRLSLQWREPHDASLFFGPGRADLYRNPLAALRLVVLRQRDPSGKSLPTDDFEVVARSSGLPQRLDSRPGSGVYEIAVEFTPAQAGRYAVRVERQVPAIWALVADAGTGRESVRLLEGLAPSGLRPLGTATLPAVERGWELRPRLFIEAIGPQALVGRPVLLDFATDVGNLGMPGDARAVFSVGAADWRGRPQPYSAKGPAAGLDLARGPDLLAFDHLDLGPGQGGVAYGSSLAAPFAAGTAAAMRGAGMTPEGFRRLAEERPGQVLVAPPPRK